MQYTFTARADRYEPVSRNYLRGRLLTEKGILSKCDVVTFEATPKDAHTAIYVLDFGDRVEVRHVSGWNNKPDGCQIFLEPFPLSQGTRPDNGRPIDMSGWMLGPSRAFHLKLKQDNPYVLGEATSQGVMVEKDNHCHRCACCHRDIWCGGSNVCGDCATNDCESVHPELRSDDEQD